MSGFWLMSYVTLSMRMKAWLGYLPGTVIVAIVAPTVFSTGLAEAGAALATVLVMARTRNVLVAMIVGIGAVWGVRLPMVLIHDHPGGFKVVHTVLAAVSLGLAGAVLRSRWVSRRAGRGTAVTIP